MKETIINPSNGEREYPVSWHSPFHQADGSEQHLAHQGGELAVLRCHITPKRGWRSWQVCLHRPIDASGRPVDKDWVVRLRGNLSTEQAKKEVERLLRADGCHIYLGEDEVQRPQELGLAAAGAFE